MEHGGDKENRHLPRFVRRMDEKSRQKWIEHRIRHHRERYFRKHLVAIFVNIIIVFVVNSLPKWSGFLTSGYGNILLIINLVLVATIIADLIYLFHEDRLFHSIIEIIINSGWIGVWYLSYRLFPFNFPPEISDTVRIVLLALAGVSIVITVYHLIKAIFFTTFKHLR